MRVRYQMAGDPTYTAVCDLEDKKAQKMYRDLQKNGLCEWGELVGEDDDNYMDILESFEQIEMARKLKSVMESLGF